MHDFQSSPPFLRGRDAEIKIAAFLKYRRGWYIFPASDYSGQNGDKAPKIQGADDEIISPDLGLVRPGRLMRWAEVKAKGGPTFTILTQQWEHGIGLRKYFQYLKFQEKVGAPVWLFILEENTQTLLFQSLDVLGYGRVYSGDEMDKGGMMFWPRTAFQCVVLDEIPGLFDPDIPLDFEK